MKSDRVAWYGAGGSVEGGRRGRGWVRRGVGAGGEEDSLVGAGVQVQGSFVGK